MRKFSTKLMFTLALTFMAVGGAKAQVDGTLIKGTDYSSMGSYEMWHSNFTDNAFSVSISEGKLLVEKETAMSSGDNWKVQYEVANEISTKKGANYLIRATLKGSVEGSLTCVLGDWTYSRNTSLAFTTTEQAVDVIIKDFPATLSNAAHVLFQSGAYAGTITISSIQVYELNSVDTYGDAVCEKDFTNTGDQFIYWKSGTAPDATYTAENGLTIVTTKAATNFWDYQYNIAQADTENGKDYIIHATVKGTADGNIPWSFGNYPNTVSGSFAVTTGWNTIELMCAAVPYTGTSDFAIQTGSYVATLYVKDVTIYPTSEGRLIQVGSAGYTTFSANKAVKMRGVTAYSAKYEGGQIVLTSVTEVPAGAGVIIEADEDNYKVPVIESAAALSGNQLLVSDGSVTGDGSTIYVLAKKSGVVGFYRLSSGGKVPAGKAYLKITAGAPEFMEIGGNATGIEATKVTKAVENGVFYNIAGQRVANPTKGLYIVNGKKVVIK